MIETKDIAAMDYLDERIVEAKKEIEELRPKAFAIINKLSDDFQITQNDLSDWIKAKIKSVNPMKVHTGFSSASISNYLTGTRDNDSTALNTRQKLKDLVGYASELLEEATLSGKKSLATDIETEGKLSLYLNNFWYLYYCKGERYTNSQNHGIGRVILHIGETADDVTLTNNSLPEDNTYEGRVELYDKRNLLFFLKTAPYKERYLFINCFVGAGKITEYSMGIYTNISENYSSLIGGRVILEHITNPKKAELKKSKTFIEGEDDYDSIAVEIRDFFKDERNNFIRTPSNVLNSNDLQHFNELEGNL